MITGALALGTVMSMGAGAGDQASAATANDGPVYRAVQPERIRTGVSLAAGQATTVTVPGVPQGARSAVVNLTAGEATASTVVTACPGTSAPSCAGGARLITGRGPTVAQQVEVPLGGPQHDRITVHNRSGRVTVYADLSGFVVDGGRRTAADGLYQPAKAPLSSTWFQLGQRASGTIRLPGVPAGAQAVALNVRLTRATRPTFVSVCPSDQGTAACVRTSAANGAPGRQSANTVVVKLAGTDRGRLTVYNDAGTTRAAVDVQGYFVSADGSATAGHPVATATTPVLRDAALAARAVRTVKLPGVPSGATAVRVRVTGTAAPDATQLSVAPAGVAPATARATPLLTVPGGGRAANTALVALGGPRHDEIAVVNGNAATKASLEVTGYTVLSASRAAQHAAPAAPTQPSGPAAPAPSSPGPSAPAASAPVAAPSATPSAKPSVPAASAPKPAAPAPETLRSSPGRGTPTAPDASTTGVPAGTRLTPHDGDLVITQAGTVVDGLDIRGFVTVKAPNVTIKNSIIRGRAVTTGSTYYPLVKNDTPGASVTVQDSELFAEHPSPNIDGLRGFDITARRLNIHDVIDDVHIYGDNVTVQSSWLHDNLHYEKDPYHNGQPSHDDNFQIQKGRNIHITANRVTGSHSSGIQVTQDAGVVADLTVVGNFFDNGACSTNIAQKQRGPVQGVLFKDNQFGRNAKYAGCAMIVSPQTHPQLVNNVYADNGQAIVMRTFPN